MFQTFKGLNVRAAIIIRGEDIKNKNHYALEFSFGIDKNEANKALAVTILI